MVKTVPALVFDADSFESKVAVEIARLRRGGGFLTLAYFAPAPKVEVAPDLRHIAESLSGEIRIYDTLGLLDSGLALLMPDTTVEEGQSAGRRLLDLTLAPAMGRPRLCGGVAGLYGQQEVEASDLLAAAEQAAEEAAPGQVVPSRTLRGCPRVLVVDDDLRFAQALSDAISDRGWEAHPCTTIDDAKQRVARPEYAALFVDLVLVRGSGIDVIRQALASQPKRPVVLMTGYEIDPTTMLDVLELGPVLFVKKPLTGTGLDVAMQMFRDAIPGHPALRR